MKLKRILVVSVFLNFLFVCMGGYVILKKGGYSYIAFKVNAVVTGEQPAVNAYYLNRTSVFASYNTTGGIVFLGDSITQGNEWSEMFPELDVKNRGINEDDTGGVLQRLPEIVQMKPDKVFIMIGTNDLSRGMTIDNTVANYDKILHQLSASQVYVQSVLPVNESVLYSKRSNQVIRKLNESLKQLSQKYNAEYVDLFSDMIDDKGQLKTDLSHDGLHINGKGYSLWKEKINSMVH